MTRQIVTLKEVTDEKDLWKLDVRIADLWTVFDKKSKQQHIEMIFLDAKGDKIQAVLPTDEMQTWKTILKEENTYVFENFSVFKNDIQFKACDHPYKLVFSGGTIGTEKILPDIPPTAYQFKDFAEINAGKFCSDLLVDLFGAINEITFKQPDAKPKNIVFTMKDASFPRNELLQTSSQISSQITTSSQFSQQDRFMYKAMVKSIQQINALSEDTTCVTIGTTGKIIPSKTGWSYLGCVGCTKREKSNDSSFTCQSGHYTEVAVPRYKVEIRVFHNKHSSKFIFWDTDCARLIGKTALELMNQMIEEGEHNPKAYPYALDGLLARTMAFRIVVQPTYNQCSVIKAWDGPQLIQTILDQIEPQEVGFNHVQQKLTQENTGN